MTGSRGNRLYSRKSYPLKQGKSQALYKRSGKKVQDNPAIIRVCRRCNNEKSLWDQEILAQYGHIVDIDRAKRAQQSIQNPSKFSSTLQIAVAISRMAAHDKKMRDIRFRDVPSDSISQWMSYCARGIYMFFEGTPFRGVGMSVIPELLDLKVNADEFNFSFANHHRINTSCAIELFQFAVEHPKTAVVFLHGAENKLYCFNTILFEGENQRNAYQQFNPRAVAPRALGIVAPRNVSEITKNTDGISYGGVKRLKS